MLPLAYRPFGAFRLLLAGLVVFQHFTANAAPAWWHDRFIGLSPGSAAVLVFFAMSGFVIGEAADRIYHARPEAGCLGWPCAAASFGVLAPRSARRAEPLVHPGTPTSAWLRPA